MRIQPIAFSLVLAAAAAAQPAKPLACRLDALNASQREKHEALGKKLMSVVVKTSELSDGYTLSLDLKKLGVDSRGERWCVVEVAQWADLESRCCPFLHFGIELRGKDGLVTLRLTGGPGVKEFLKTELGLDRI